MIIQIRGTSGSGKSYVMRKIMEGLTEAVGEPTIRYRASGGKKTRPIGYCFNPNLQTMVLGPYQSVCGGCDAIGSAPRIFEEIVRFKQTPPKARNILCEGLLLSEDTKWTFRLPDYDEVRVIFLTTPVERCLSQVESRRKAAGNDKPLNPKNTVGRVAVIDRAEVKLKQAGIACHRASSAIAPAVVLKWLGVT